ncbi:hypothetical protein FLAG1_01129 [Fusarium langsethiae]|uniref:Uncharacterized protein n=1 Tax=Fusarium langsethiae TaxID=179993 RepID=A0A0M9F4N5_FUSLA|nr:hypothetical protein FLAG1_01129 [Fusarium langsethiae]
MLSRFDFRVARPYDPAMLSQPARLQVEDLVDDRQLLLQLRKPGFVRDLVRIPVDGWQAADSSSFRRSGHFIVRGLRKWLVMWNARGPGLTDCLGIGL